VSRATPYNKIVSLEGYVSADPLPSAEELSRFYAEVYFQQQASSTYQAEYSDDELAQKRLRSAVTIHSVNECRGTPTATGHRFVDVGCGEGFMLAEAQKAGFDIVGLDFSSYGIDKFHPDLAKYTRRGDAIDLVDEMIASGERAEVCVLQNVLEHVRDPKQVMGKLRKLVRPDGLVVITVPNDYSRTQERLQELGLSDHEYWFVPPQHLHYFNSDNLQRFARSMSFEIVDMFGDFPIEMFLFHPASNYVLDRKQGKDAHRARVLLDLMLAERGLKPYLQFCRALATCGMGRNVTFVLKPAPMFHPILGTGHGRLTDALRGEA
jgi:2-polyprenyl-3-methyl-5-hydroxy-6-metoxy-1,4-benzoquinol methylase